MKIVDYAPRRAPKQRRFRDLIPGSFVIAACVLAPAEIPHQTAAALPYPYVSPVPQVNRGLMPSIPLPSRQAGGSAVRQPASPTPKPLPTQTDRREIVEIVREVFGDEARTALAIAQAESGLDCQAHSPTNDAGLFQIHMPSHAEKFQGHSPYDCYANALVAKQIYDRQGWSPWAVYASGKYRRFL